MKKEVFKIRVQEIAHGWSKIFMLINDKEVYFDAGYLTPEPLASLVEACWEMVVDAETNYYDTHYIEYHLEPGYMEMELQLDENNMLHLNIKETDDDDKKVVINEWHETIPFNDFAAALIYESFRVLNALGLYGYRCSWSKGTDFPLSVLLRIEGKIKPIENGESNITDISKELNFLQKYINDLAITEEKKMDKCTIFYEAWHFEWCFDYDTFAVGDHIEWTCIMPEHYKNAHGIILDLEEDHCGFATHRVTGKISKIIAERSEFPKGKKEVWYHRAQTIQEETQLADGHESNFENDDTTDRTFWGYIVTLTDVTITPLEK